MPDPAEREHLFKKVRTIFPLFLAGIFICAAVRTHAEPMPASEDPFQPLLQDIDRNLAPAVTVAQKVEIKGNKGEVIKIVTGGSEVVPDVKFFTYPDGQEVDKAVNVQHVTFKSTPVYFGEAWHDDTIVYAQVAMPAGAKAGDKLPGLLLLHGGASYAQSDDMYRRVLRWAAAGYVVVTCDLPGIADAKYADVGSGTWQSVAYPQIPRFVASPDIRASWIYTAEATALKAFALLKAQPAVDPAKLGITGISWGGYSTTMLSGLLGSRTAAAFSVFGCGFYDEDSAWKSSLVFPSSLPQGASASTQQWRQSGAATWLTYLDAGRRASGIKAHFYIAASANDHFFRPSAVVRTLKAITNASSLDFQFSPNSQPDPSDHDPAHDIAYYATRASHTILTPGGSQAPPSSHPPPNRSWCGMEAVYLDYLLKGVGAPLSHIALIGSPKAGPQGDFQINFTVTADPSVSLQAPQLYYSVHTPNDTWEKRNWLPLDAPITAGSVAGKAHPYAVTMPAAVASQGVDWYVLVSDRRGAWATTTSTLVENFPGTAAPGAR